MKRSRGRGRRQTNPANRSYDSNGPDVRVRGTANQVYEKYQALARDAQASGDRVAAENLMQHAEHYYRILLTIQGPKVETEEDDAEAMDGNNLDQDETALATSEEADEDDASDKASDGETDATSDGAYEPLILSRDQKSESASEEKGDGGKKPAGRRRGPLRRRQGSKADTADSGDSFENVVGE